MKSVQQYRVIKSFYGFEVLLPSRELSKRTAHSFNCDPRGVMRIIEKYFEEYLLRSRQVFYRKDGDDWVGYSAIPFPNQNHYESINRITRRDEEFEALEKLLEAVSQQL